MEDNIIDQLEEEIITPPPYNPDYQPGLDNTINHYLRLEDIEENIEEISRIQVRPDIHTATAMFVLGNRRHNRLVHRPQLHVQDIPPLLENEQNIQIIKQENNGTKPKTKKVVKPTSDLSGYESEYSDYSDKQKHSKFANNNRHYDPLNPRDENIIHHGQHRNNHDDQHRHESDPFRDSPRRRDDRRDDREDRRRDDRDRDRDRENRRRDRSEPPMPRRLHRRDNSSGPSSSSSSDTESEWNRRTPSVNRDHRQQNIPNNKDLLENFLTSSQMSKLKTLLQDSSTATDLNIAKILKLIPNNLVWGSCEHERIFKQIKILGKIPNSYGEETNPYTFFNSFKYLEEYEVPFTHSSYNNIIIHYFNADSRNKLDMLEIDPNSLSAQDFVKSILTTIGAELLNPQDYERKFHTYRITPEDEDRPNRTVINLAAMLQKTGNSQENQMAKLREKICTYLVPLHLQSAFLSSTNIPNCTKETILSWFSNNRSYYNTAIERKRRLEKQKNVNVNQVENKDTKTNNNKDKKETPKNNHNNNNSNKNNSNNNRKPVNKGGNNKNEKNATLDVSNQPKPICEHCEKPHWSNHCLKHPDPAIRKANADWWDKKNKEKALANRIICLLCNSDTHGSADCPFYPNTTPSQEQCPRCLHYGIPRRHHPVNTCTLPPPAEKNG